MRIHASTMLMLVGLMWLLSPLDRVASGQSTRPLEVPEALRRTILKATLGAWWGGVLVVKDGQSILAQGFGLGDEALEPIDADSLFDIGSVSKQFTAATILRLNRHGALSIDDNVAK